MGNVGLTYANHDSTVPKRRSSVSCACCTSGILSNIQRSFIAEKYVDRGSPVLFCHKSWMDVSLRNYLNVQQTYRSRIRSFPFVKTPGSVSMPSLSSLCSKSATVPFVRESSQTIALQIGFPVFRLHTTVVSRWLVIPWRNKHQNRDATVVRGSAPIIWMLSFAHPAASRTLTASSMHSSTKCCISSASCSCHLKFNTEKGVLKNTREM